MERFVAKPHFRIDEDETAPAPAPREWRRAAAAAPGPTIVRQADPRLRALFALLAPSLDIVATLATAITAGALYHLATYGDPGVLETQLQMGALIALIILIHSLIEGAYDLPRYLTPDGHVLRVFKQWNLAFLLGLGLMFFTKTGAIFSRGAVLLFYLCGFVALSGARLMIVHGTRALSRHGPALARRVFLVGPDAAILSFVSRHWPLTRGVQIVGVANIAPAAIEAGARGAEWLDRDLQAAVARARRADPDDVFLLLDRHRDEIIDLAIDCFLTIPAAIHLGAERMLHRFGDAKVTKIGEIPLLSLTRRPLSPPEVAVKRLFDLGAAGVATLLLAPLALVVAAAIKLDSKGPVFFLQRRYGFNQKPFRIIKFRTMTSMEDGPIVRQVAEDDARITRVGRFLRRWNIDELPQLLNVMRGEMSLVGPRPHALAHDHHFMRRIAWYARRHNVKPGITGWAQVNGFRGETTADEKMRGRVEHDLHYIDSWSFLLDLTIILLTVFSPKAYRNAR